MIRDDLAADLSRALVSLDDPTCEAPAVTGNKAATLARLRRAGFPVPPGVVVCAEAIAAVDGEVPARIRAAFQELPERLGPGPWAVRSSGIAEDSATASFAGLFETVLGVGQDGLVDAVLRCVHAARAERVVTYGGDASRAMAILIQPMVAARAAGVAFTVDPITGRRRTMIEAVDGLGDRLVSGAVTPERWVVEGDGSIDAPPGATALDASQALGIAELARQVERHLGRPQDVEWAIVGGRAWLLQARPITSLPGPAPELEPIPLEVPPGFWTRDAFHEPLPLSPFGRVMLTEQILKVFPAVFAEFGVLVARAEVATIGGWTYNRTVPLGAPPPGQGGWRGTGSPPRWLMSALVRLHPAIRRRTDAARAAVGSDLPAAVIRRWDAEWRPELQADIDRALALDLDAMSDEELAAELDHRIAVVGRPPHVMVAIAWMVLVYELAEACRELLDWDTARMLSLLEGLSTTSTEPARRLADLARLARSRPAVRELLRAVDETTLGRLAGVDPEFAREFERYVTATGHRALRYDVVDPTLAESPLVLLRLVADQVETGFSPERVAAEAGRRREEAAAEARTRLASRSARDRDRFQRALAQASQAYPAWEDRVWTTQSVQTALLRYLGLAIGRRLSGRGQLAAVDDVFFLDVHEARGALLGGDDCRETTRRRRAQREWAIAHPGPATYGEAPTGEPPFEALPAPARLVNRAVLWGFEQFFGQAAPGNAEGVLAGTPASPGRYTGPVRVVMGEHQLDRIRAGDVVVCPVTSPVWSVAFPNMGALVTDNGGILSHPAIIAREYGIPAVVGTGNATRVFEDGQQVTVDGGRGVVELVPAGLPARRMS